MFSLFQVRVHLRGREATKSFDGSNYPIVAIKLGFVSDFEWNGECKKYILVDCFRYAPNVNETLNLLKAQKEYQEKHRE